MTNPPMFARPHKNRCIVLQHVGFEGSGIIGPWAVARGFEVRFVRPFQGDAMPSQAECDILVIMGGPMSVHDEADHPWLVAEKRFIASILAEEKPVMGICLGAQLIAHVLGARVYGNDHKEIGWYPVEWTRPALEHPILRGFNREINVLHWHQDRFDIPEGALHLASSRACPTQGYLYRQHVLGLQCHMEMTVRRVHDILNACYDSEGCGRYIQTRCLIERHTRRYLPASQYWMRRLMDNWLQGCWEPEYMI